MRPENVSTHTEYHNGQLYWKRKNSHNWVLGQLIAVNGLEQKGIYRHIDEMSGEALKNDHVPIDETLDLRDTCLQPANSLFTTAADMTHLMHLNEPSIAKNLQDRYAPQNQRPYTFMANVLIAVNPLKPLEHPEKHAFIGQSLDECAPHPFHIAESAYRQLCILRAAMQNQAIIISGESGSGKTETSKIILDFLTTRHEYGPDLGSEDIYSESELTKPNDLYASSEDSIPNDMSASCNPTLGERLMETIPILESFGNAKTHWNHNSSRFGKYMRLQFSNRTHALTGASIETYLLEKSRIGKQPIGERNFHIFYELLASDDVHFLETELHLTANSPEKYRYLIQSTENVVSYIDKSDAAHFKQLCSALHYIGISTELQHQLFRLVAGLLHLGNVRFEDTETNEGCVAALEENDHVQKSLEYAATLLQVPRDELIDCMLTRRITTRHGRRGSIYYVKRDTRTALYSRDTIAKTIYEHAFHWLMTQCAYSLDYDSERADVIPYIGVLDIFGFEDFEPKNRNSFEQLLINYANEKLQSLFNHCIFEAEQELYRKENIYSPSNVSLLFPFAARTASTPSKAIGINSVQYTNNDECVQLIASRHGGIFSTLDNISRLPLPSDQKLNERLHTLFKRHPHFPSPHPKLVHDAFQICHYAGIVTYHIHSFIDKNNNIVSEQFEELLKKSNCAILTEIAPLNHETMEETGQSLKEKRNRKHLIGGSVSNLFSKQMTGLCAELEGTNCNFVRCIKPNIDMISGMFDKAYVLEQLQCSGTVQACEVLRAGLSTRILYAEIMEVYKVIVDAHLLQIYDGNERLFTQSLLWFYKIPEGTFQLGDTRLFLKTGQLNILDKILNPVQSNMQEISTQLKWYRRRKWWISAVTKVIVYIRFCDVYYECKHRQSAVRIQCIVRRWLAIRQRVYMMKLIRIRHRWDRIVRRRTVIHVYRDLPDEKMILLNHLLRKLNLNQHQLWLLKWLGPLQQVLYMQKRWRRLRLQYTAKQGFLWLLLRVRKRRSVQLLQKCIRMCIARRRVHRLKQAQRARKHWRILRHKLRVVRVFCDILRRVHVLQLEQENVRLQQLTLDSEKYIERLQIKLQRIKVAYHQLQEKSTLRFNEYELEKKQLERKWKAAQAQSSAPHFAKKPSLTVWDRMVRLFTCTGIMFGSFDDAFTCDGVECRAKSNVSSRSLSSPDSSSAWTGEIHSDSSLPVEDERRRIAKECLCRQKTRLAAHHRRSKSYTSRQYTSMYTDQDTRTRASLQGTVSSLYRAQT